MGELLNRFNNVTNKSNNISKEQMVKDLTDVVIKYDGIFESSKNYHPNVIKKGDVVYSRTLLISHPTIVFRVEKEYIYALMLTTKEKHSIAQVTGSRIYNDSFYTYNIIRLTKEDALRYWIGIFDNMRELRLVLKQLKTFYNKIL